MDLASLIKPIGALFLSVAALVELVLSHMEVLFSLVGIVRFQEVPLRA